MSYVEYDSNNSGGSWWLKDSQWEALEAAGWRVVWQTHKAAYDGNSAVMEGDMPALVMKGSDGIDAFAKPDENGDVRWLGALATSAYRSGLSMRDAVEEWERVTGESATDAGCPCCGNPHNFTEYDDAGKWVDSGPQTSYEASF